jgi:indole-3-glycerol phosphate synthase
MYDTYQVTEARALNADCILIIMASVSDQQAEELEHAAVSWNMNVLIEVHNEIELERAMNLKSPMIGVNNRDLKTFETSLETTKRLSKLLPSDRLIVSESGLFNTEDLRSMAELDVRSFLIGESLMRQPDVKTATQKILSNPLRP